MGTRVLVVLAALLIAAPALAQERGDAARGLAYAKAVCAECHETSAGHFDSPTPEALPFQDIANAEGMTEIALFAFFRTSHASMPNLVIPPEHIADLTAYLLSIRNHR
jgi:mono/diheme cytochrome c family protein